MAEISVALKQHGETASLATIRDHQFVLDRPEAKGGTNAGPMGGEALLASVGGCFMSNLRAAISARDGVQIDGITLSITATLADAGDRFAAVHLEVAADADQDELQKLVTIADRARIAANTIRSAVELTVSVGQKN